MQQFVDRLLPPAEPTEVDKLVAAGYEASLLAALELEPGNPAVVVALAERYADEGRTEEVLALLDRIPPSPETRRLAARARVEADGGGVDDDIEGRLDGLLEHVRDDDRARQEFLDLLELLGPGDPRTLTYRRALTTRLF